MKAWVKRYHDWIREQPCVNCGAHGVQVSHYNGVSGGYLGRGISSKADDLAVCPHCPECHELVEKRGMWRVEGESHSFNKVSHSEGMAIQVLQTIIRARDAGILKV